MGAQLIDQFIDRAKVTTDKQFLLDALETIDKKFAELSTKEISLKGGGSTKELIDGLNKLSEATNKLKSSQSELDAARIRSEKVAQQQLKTEQEVIKTIAAEEKAEQERIRTDKLREEQARRTAKALKDKADSGKEIPFTTNLNADGTVIEPAQGATSGSIVTEVERAQVEGILTAKEYAEAQKGVSASFVQSQSNAAKYAVTQKEIDLALAQDKLTAQKRTAELKNQVREETAVKGSIEQRRAALVRLNAVYDNLSPQERNAAAGQRLQKITAGITEQLKQLEAASGRTSRNVGNYPVSSFNGLKSQLKEVTDQYNNLTKAEQKSAQGKELKGKIDTISKSLKEFGDTSTISFSKAYSGIRILANILPGLGISGIFLLAGQAIAATVDWVKELAGKVVDFAEKMKVLKDVNFKAIESFGAQRSHLEGLTAVIKDGNISLDDKKRALTELIALDPKYLHGLTLANITTDEGKKILNDYIALLRRKAELEAATAVQGDASKEVYKLEVIKDLLRKRLVATKTNYDDLTEEELKYVDKVKTSTGRINFTASLLNLEIPKSDIQEMLVGVDKELKKASTKVTASMDVFKDKFKAVGNEDVKLGVVESLKKQIADLDKSIETETVTSKINGLVNSRKKLQDQLDALLGKEDKARKVKTISDAVAELRKELSAIQGKVDLGELGPKEADIERVKSYNKAFEDIFKRGGKTSTPIVQKLNLELDPIEQRVLEAQIKDFAERVRSEAKLEIPLAVDEAGRELIIKNTSAAVQKIIDSNDKLYAKDLENLNKRLIEKKISQEDYNKAVEALQKDHVRTEITNAIELNQALIDNLKARGYKVTKFEEELNEQKQKLYELDAKAAIEADNKKRKSAQELAEAKRFLAKQEIDLAKDVANLLVTLVNASYETQKNNLADLQKAKDENYSTEIENVRNSTLSDKEKADQTTLIEAKQASDKRKYDAEIRELDIKKAKFERLTNIAKIVAATAAAEVQALSYLSNPFTAPAYPGIAATIAAIGAVQLATLLATPLPRYKDGKFDNYAGFAIVGDGGKSEAIFRADGSIEKTPAQPTMAYVGSKDIVFPDFSKFISTISTTETDRVINHSFQKQNPNKEIIMAYRQSTNSIVAAIRSIPRPKVTIHNDADFNGWVKKNVKGL